jgi:hypothetical protein
MITNLEIKGKLGEYVIKIPTPITQEEHDLIIETKHTHEEVLKVNIKYTDDIQNVGMQAFAQLAILNNQMKAN